MIDRQENIYTARENSKKIFRKTNKGKFPQLEIDTTVRVTISDVDRARVY